MDLFQALLGYLLTSSRHTDVQALSISSRKTLDTLQSLRPVTLRNHELISCPLKRATIALP